MQMEKFANKINKKKRIKNKTRKNFVQSMKCVLWRVEYTISTKNLKYKIEHSLIPLYVSSMQRMYIDR